MGITNPEPVGAGLDVAEGDVVDRKKTTKLVTEMAGIMTPTQVTQVKANATLGKLLREDEREGANVEKLAA